MKNHFLPAILFVFIFYNGFTQTIDTVYPNLDNLASIKEHSGLTWAIINNQLELYYINHEGQVTGSLAIGEDIGYNKIILDIFDGFNVEDDSFTYFHTLDHHCDYWENEVLMKVDKNGEVVDTFFILRELILSGVRPYPPGIGHPKYIYPDENSIAFYYDFNNIVQIPFSPHIVRIDVNNEGHIAILTPDSILYYELHTGQFVLTDQIAVNYLSYRFHDLFFTSDGELIFVTETSLMWYENKLQNPEILETASDFKIIFAKETHGNLVIETMDPEGEVYAGVMMERQVIYDKMLGYDELYFNDVLWIKDSLYVFVGHEIYPEDKGFSILKTIDFGTAAVDKSDVSIDDIKFNHVRPIGGYHCYGDSTNVYSVENITMTITNHGTQPINRLLITPLKSYCYFFCDRETLSENEILDMDLQPGETDEFYIGHISVHVRFNEPQDELCLLAVQPDMHIDANHDNNQICFSTTVSIDDEKLISKPTLFPNPVSDILQLSNYEEIKSIAISNANGFRISSNVEFAETGIDMSSFIPGMYIVELELDNGNRVVDRVVKF